MDTKFIGLAIIIVLYSTFEADGISQRQIIYIQSLIEKFSACPPAGVIPPPAIDVLSSEQHGSDSIILPSVILWNPLHVFKSSFPNGCMPCPDCGKTATVHFWRDGSTPNKMPRTIYGLHSPVLLVSAVIVCDTGHRTLSHDERVLRLIPTRTLIPFILLYRTGLTLECAETILTLCSQGMNFYSIESLLCSRYWDEHSKHALVYYDSVKSSKISDSPPFPQFDFLSPSNDLIRKCFITHFLNNEDMYLKEINTLPVTDSLSFDHTFKVASNIGYLREDKKWINMYDSLFIVFNGQGQIILWHFTKSSSFANVESSLISLSERGKSQKTVVENIYIDNCCQWKKKIGTVFGGNVQVHLNLFHAVQRVIKKIPKRHPYSYQCCLEFRLVFHQSDDIGEVRKKQTPNPSVLMKNIDNFVTKWKTIESNGIHVLNSEALHEVNNLKVHISRGCLSDLPPGCGTNLNEAFHSNIRAFFNRSRIGVLLAYALLSVIIANHNSRIPNKHRRLSEPFHARVLKQKELQSQQKIYPMGFINDERHLRNDDSWTQDQSSTILDNETIEQIITTSISQHQLADQFRKRAKVITLWQYVPFMSNIHSLSCGMSVSQHDIDEHISRLDAVTKSWGFSRIAVPGDGDCFFTSVGLSILTQLSTLSEHLQSRGIVLQMDGNISVLVLELRKLMVNELLANRHLYDGFFEDNFEQEKYEHEVKKFLNQSYYDSNIGNAMPLAMARALSLPIVIYTSIKGCPVVYLSPENSSTEGTLFLAYNQHGTGHYDLACQVLTDSSSANPVSCRCGVNRDGPACVHNIRYHSRCKCLQNNQGCSHLCQCKNCKNPFGFRLPSVCKRKRQRNKWQLNLPTTKEFAVDRTENVVGMWSLFESIVFVNIINKLADLCIDESIENIHGCFSEIVVFVQSPSCSKIIPNVFGYKTVDQIRGKYQHYAKEKELFLKCELN